MLGFDGITFGSRTYATQSASGEASSLTRSNATAVDALGYHYKTIRDAGKGARIGYQCGIGPFTGYIMRIQSPFLSGNFFGSFSSRSKSTGSFTGYGSIDSTA